MYTSGLSGLRDNLKMLANALGLREEPVEERASRLKAMFHRVLLDAETRRLNLDCFIYSPAGLASYLKPALSKILEPVDTYNTSDCLGLCADVPVILDRRSKVFYVMGVSTRFGYIFYGDE